MPLWKDPSSKLKHVCLYEKTHLRSSSLLSAELQNKVHCTDEQTKSKLAPDEENNRIKDQRVRLEGLRLKREEECSHQSYDLVLNVVEKDALVYLSPKKFATRRSELLLRKAPKEISIDQSSLIIRDKDLELPCSTATELEATNALRRRALAFDIVKVCGFHSMNSYHAGLFDHLHSSTAWIAQLLRADRAAWLHMADKLTTLKREMSIEIYLWTGGWNQGVGPSVSQFPSIAFASKSCSREAPAKGQSHEGSKIQNATKMKGARAKAKKAVDHTAVDPMSRKVWSVRVSKDPMGTGCAGLLIWSRVAKRLNWGRDASVASTCVLSQFAKKLTACSITSDKSHRAAKFCPSHPIEAFGPAPTLAIFLYRSFCRNRSPDRFSTIIRPIRDSFGIDLKLPTSLRSPIIKFDLLIPEHVALVQQLINSQFCLFVHFAPPCGTSSRARLIQRKGRWNPPILRTDQHPNGLPTLEGTLLSRVTSSQQVVPNHLWFDWTLHATRRLLRRGKSRQIIHGRLHLLLRCSSVIVCKKFVFITASTEAPAEN